MRQYLKEVRAEMRRVTWPTRKETRDMSVATISILAVSGVTLWLVDTALVGLLAILSKLA